MRILFLTLILWIVVLQKSNAQYISRSEPDPSFNCPVVCQGGTLQLKVFQIENFPNGTQIQALLSNAVGSFATGSQILPVAQFSNNNGTTWNNGPYLFSSNTNNLLIRITIPVSTSIGAGYTIKMRASTGYTSNDLFQCSGGNAINVIAANSPLSPVSQNQSGNGQWIGHVYTWTPTISSVLSSPSLIATQDFFNTNNYLGHAVYNALNLDLFFSTTGGVPGSTANGSSFNCGLNYTSNYSMRLRRTENFAPGFYQLSIQGDDGIRLSVDGGTTWLLDSFIEQAYGGSFRSTATSFPNGICLSENTDLVIEYFQRPADARLTFTITPLSVPTLSNPQSIALCASESATFSVNSINGYSYQWFESSDNGNTFSALSNTAPYSGATGPNLTINPVVSALDGNLYYCLASGSCGTPLQSNPALLTLNSGPNTVQDPVDAVYCSGQPLAFSGGLIPNGTQVQWEFSNDGGSSFSAVSNGAQYSGVNTSTLTVLNPTDQVLGDLYRICYTSCGQTACSNAAEILPGNSVSISQQPEGIVLCNNSAGTIQTDAVNAAAFVWQINSGGVFVDFNQTPQPGFTTSNSSTLNIDGALAGEGNYTVRCRITGSCTGDVFSIPVNISILAATSLDLQPQNLEICEGQNAVFSLSASGTNPSYQWQQSSDNGQTFTALQNSPNISGATTSQLSISNIDSLLDSTVYQCIISNTCGALTSQSAQLTVSASPALLQQPSSQAACVGQAVLISAVGANASEWQWLVSSDNGASFQPLSDLAPFSGTDSPTLTIDSLTENLNGMQFQAQVSGCGNTASSDAITLTVNANPDIEISSPAGTIALGDTIALSVQGDATFSWSPSESLSCNDCNEPLAFPTVNTTYFATATNAAGCIARDSIEIEVDFVCGAVFIPTVFSPNGKGPVSNETFCAFSDCVGQFKLVIYNRWGELIFETSNISNCWDGTYKGEQVQSGVYAYNLYLMQLDGKVVNKTGTITLVK
jgi:gliding motility-associated-like protein